MRRLAPALCLAAYGAAFAVVAFGSAVPAAGEHPAQLFRLWHALERTFPHAAWTADWNPDWWAGYPDLQFTPPGVVLLGAAIRLGFAWLLPVEVVYRLLCGVLLLLPAAGTFALLRGALGDRWLALPPAFVALVLSAGLHGGLETGLRTGALADRLAIGVLPLLLLSLAAWADARRGPAWVAITSAALVLAHPGYAPAAAVAVGLAAALRLTHDPPRHVARQLGVVAGMTVALTAFWALPRVVRAAWAVPPPPDPLTLGELGAALASRPLLLGLGAGALCAWVAVARRRRGIDTLLAALPLGLAGLLVVDLPLHRAGWPAADPRRLADVLVLSSLWAAGLGIGTLSTVATATPRRAARARPAIAVALVGLVLLAAWLSPAARAGQADLTLWPRAARWPALTAVSEARALPALWAALRGGPDRVLFATPPLAVDGENAGRAFVLSLAPVLAGREILGGTPPHPSPLAARLADPSAALAPGVFEPLARRLRIATVVVAEGTGAPRPPGDDYRAARHPPGFAVFERRDRPWSHEMERITHRRYRVLVSPAGGVWIATGVPAYPLWHAKSGRGPLPTRVDAWGLLEIRVPIDLFEAELVYVEGWIEWSGLGLTLAGVLAWLAWLRRARTGPARRRAGRP